MLFQVGYLYFFPQQWDSLGSLELENIHMEFEYMQKGI